MRLRRTITLQAAGSTTGNGTVVNASDLAGAKDITIYIIGSAGISAGAVQLEHAHDPAYAGTWAAIGAAQSAVASGIVALTVSNTAVLALRARISTNIVGGSVTVIMVARG